MSKPYPIPDITTECEVEIKKSRFIARATSVCSREEAMLFLAQAKSDYPDARHHCWAYLIGNPSSASSAAMNDDGEPGGTAGKPILNVIQHKGIGDVMVVVIRYFGGIKLGAGGLTRAYSNVTEALFSAMTIKQQQLVNQIQISCDFAQEQTVRYWARMHNAQIEMPIYTQEVEMAVTLPEEHTDDLVSFCEANGIKYSSKGSNEK